MVKEAAMVNVPTGSGSSPEPLTQRCASPRDRGAGSGIAQTAVIPDAMRTGQVAPKQSQASWS
jgi:hypothetical protein